jgi:hypothetical protein
MPVEAGRFLRLGVAITYSTTYVSYTIYTGVELPILAGFAWGNVDRNDLGVVCHTVGVYMLSDAE